MTEQVGNFRFRKSHLIWLKTLGRGQVIAAARVSSFDRCVFRAGAASLGRANEYEALRRILSRKIGKLLRFQVAARPFVLVTAKPREIRMGKGKGAFSHFLSPFRPGYEIARFGWCQRFFLPPLFAAARNAAKKSRGHLRF